MTYPVTPNPGVHIDPTAASARRAQVQTELQSLEGLFSALPGQILNAVVNSILKALGWGSTSSTTPGGMAADIENALAQLYAQASTAATNISALITNAEGQSIADLIAWLNNAQAAWTQLGAFLSTGNYSDLTAAWNDLVQVFLGSGTSTGLFGSIAAPAVVNVVQNLQLVSDFPDAASVSGSAQWSWDGTHDHTGTTGSGSAKVVADGTLQALGGTPGAVQPGQVITPTAWVEWSGLSAAGGTSPIQLQLIPGTLSASGGFTPGTPIVVAEITSPGASSSWVQPTPVTAGSVVAGAYTVPPSGVSGVRSRLVLTADATAGSVWWDDCADNVSGGFLADMQSDTNNIIDSFAPGGTSAEFVTGVQNLLALVGLSPTSIGTATDLTALWTAIVNDFINPLNALEISAINGLASALSALLGTTTFQTLLDSVANALGHSGTGHTITNIETYLGLIPPANVGNVLGGANLGSDVSSVNTTATNGTAWSTRLTNDLVITSDVFHLVYQAGSTGDAPGHLGTNGKPTWYSAWNDLLALSGIVNSTTAPTDAAPTVGTAITTAQSTASSASSAASAAQSTLNTTNTNLFGSTTPGTAIITAAVPSGIAATKISNVLGGANLGADVTSVHTTAANGSAWSTRLTNDLLVLSDVFHLTYAAGTSTDPPGTLSGGKPTWYSCWNDLLSLTGVVNSVTAPTDTAPTTGATIQANTASATTAGTNASIAISSASAANTLAQGTIDGLNSAWSTGGTGNPVSTVPTIAAAIPASAVVGLTGAAVAFGAVGGGNATTGVGASTLSTSWTHNIASGDLGVLVGVSYAADPSSTWSSAVTYGGTAMTLLKSQPAASAVAGTKGFLDVYWLKAPASGSQTVSVSVSIVSGSGAVAALYGDSMSYSGSKVGTVGGNTGGGSTSLSMSAASTTGHMIVGFFTSYVNNNNTLSAYSQTQRYNRAFTTVGLAAAYGDAAGASSVSFTATNSFSTQQWCGVTVELEN